MNPSDKDKYGNEIVSLTLRINYVLQQLKMLTNTTELLARDAAKLEENILTH